MEKKTEYKDIRTLCYRCARDMIRAGMKLVEHNKQKSRCDKCGWVGHDYEVKQKNSSGALTP